MERALGLADGDNGFGLFGRGGGLQRRRRVDHAIHVGDGDDSGLGSGARRLIAGDRRSPGDGIAWANGKDGNWFYMSAHALGHASTSVEGDVIRIMREDGRNAAAPVPNAVMSVFVRGQLLEAPVGEKRLQQGFVG